MASGRVKARTRLPPGMATGWNGNEKRPKEQPKVHGGRRKPGGVAVPKAKADGKKPER